MHDMMPHGHDCQLRTTPQAACRVWTCRVWTCCVWTCVVMYSTCLAASSHNTVSCSFDNAALQLAVRAAEPTEEEFEAARRRLESRAAKAGAKGGKGGKAGKKAAKVVLESEEDSDDGDEEIEDEDAEEVQASPSDEEMEEVEDNRRGRKGSSKQRRGAKKGARGDAMEVEAGSEDGEDVERDQGKRKSPLKAKAAVRQEAGAASRVGGSGSKRAKSGRRGE